MDILCPLCSRLTATMMCSCNSARFCASCIDYHISCREFAIHRIQSIESIEVANSEQQTRQADDRTLAIDSFKQKVPELQEKIEALGERLADKLATSRDELLRMIDEIYSNRERSLKAKVREACNYLGLLSSEVDMWKPPAELNVSMAACSVVDRLRTPSDLDTLDFVTEVPCKPASKIRVALEDALSTSIQLHPTGKPVHLYFLKAKSTEIKRFNIFSGQMSICEVRNPIEFSERICWIELPNGTVLITGGWVDRAWVSDTFLFNPVRGTIDKLGQMQRARSSHCSVYCSGRAYVLGGATGTGTTASCEVLDLSSETWSYTASMAKEKSMFTATVFQDKIYALGDTELEVFDPQTNKFDVFPHRFENAAIAMLTSRNDHLLAFRDSELDGIDLRSQVVYRICEIDQKDWWSQTNAIVKGDEVFVLLSSTNVVVKFNLITRSLSEVLKFNPRR